MPCYYAFAGLLHVSVRVLYQVQAPRVASCRLNKVQEVKRQESARVLWPSLRDIIYELPYFDLTNTEHIRNRTWSVARQRARFVLRGRFCFAVH